MVDSWENWDSWWCGWSTVRKIGLLGGADGRQLGNWDSGWCGWSTVRKIGILGSADGRQSGKLGCITTCVLHTFSISGEISPLLVFSSNYTPPIQHIYNSGEISPLFCNSGEISPLFTLLQCSIIAIVGKFPHYCCFPQITLLQFNILATMAKLTCKTNLTTKKAKFRRLLLFQQKFLRKSMALMLNNVTIWFFDGSW